MSQRHATTVHRFVVEDTIEAAILNLRGQDDDGQHSHAGPRLALTLALTYP